MNKLLIILLAICLANAHAFVKRDAPKEDTSINTLAEDAKKVISELQGKLQSALAPENVKKNFGEIVDGFNQFYEHLKPAEAPKA